MSENPKRVVVLISGRGSNLGALLANESDQNYRIVAVVSDRDAPGLELARSKGITTKFFLLSDYPSRKQQREALFAAVQEAGPDLVLLAGFMVIIPKQFTEQFHGKLINIHPSLLPKFPGLDSHQRALSAGDKVHGCSVHFVDDGMDTGPLIAQATCPILSDDNAEILAARVLAIEHRLYPWVATMFCQSHIQLIDNQVSFSEQALEQAKNQHFILTIEKTAD